MTEQAPFYRKRIGIWVLIGLKLLLRPAYLHRHTLNSIDASLDTEDLRKVATALLDMIVKTEIIPPEQCDIPNT